MFEPRQSQIPKNRDDLFYYFKTEFVCQDLLVDVQMCENKHNPCSHKLAKLHKNGCQASLTLKRSHV